MRHITATLINLYHVCHREMWLHGHEIRMEHTSDIVTEGKLIGENSYTQRAAKYTELEFDGVKIDYYDAKNKIVHEVKKSDRAEQAHIAQVKYYLYVLDKNGITGAKGLIEYPKARHTEGVEFNDADRVEIEKWVEDIQRILALAQCPATINKPSCKKCSYYDFCYSSE